MTQMIFSLFKVKVKPFLPKFLPLPLTAVSLGSTLGGFPWMAGLLFISNLVYMGLHPSKRSFLMVGASALGILLGSLLIHQISEFMIPQDFKAYENQSFSLVGNLTEDVRMTENGWRRGTLLITQAPDFSWVDRELDVMGSFPTALRGDTIQITKQSLRMNSQESEGRAFLWIDHPSQWQQVEVERISKVRQVVLGSLEGFWSSLSGQVDDWLRALFLGDRTYLLLRERTLFQEAGLIHVLALSGFHLGFWTLGFSFLLTRVLSRQVAGKVLPLALLLYVLLVGFFPSLVRAWIFVLVLVFYRTHFLRVEPWSVVALTFIGSLIFSPNLITSLGFWLSLAAFAALITDQTGRFGFIMFRLFLFISPLLLTFFGQVPLVGFLLTPVVGLLVAWLMMGGLIAGLCYLLFPAGLPVVDGLLREVVRLIETILLTAYSYAFPIGIRGYLLIVMAGALTFLFWKGYLKIKVTSTEGSLV